MEKKKKRKEQHTSSSSTPSKQKKVKWNYNQKHAPLQHKMGFFITCDTARSHESSREVLALLTEYTELLYPQVKELVSSKGTTTTTSEAEKGEQEEEEEKELELGKALEEELKKLKEKGKGGGNELLRQKDLGVKGTYFVELHKEVKGVVDPVVVAKRVLHTSASKALTRWTSRIVPVQDTCTTAEEEMEKAAKRLLNPIFNGETAPKKYSVVCKSRCNSDLKSLDVIQLICRQIDKKNIVDLVNPDWVVSVEIFTKTCCLTVTTEYNLLRRFNARELSKYGTKEQKSSTQETQSNEVDLEDKTKCM